MEEDDFRDEDGTKGLKDALDEAEAELAAVYRKVWPLREAYAEAFPTADLPPRRARTEKQERVARCPRCGGRLREESDDVQAVRSGDH